MDKQQQVQVDMLKKLFKQRGFSPDGVAAIVFASLAAGHLYIHTHPGLSKVKKRQMLFDANLFVCKMVSFWQSILFRSFIYVPVYILMLLFQCFPLLSIISLYLFIRFCFTTKEDTKTLFPSDINFRNLKKNDIKAIRYHQNIIKFKKKF